VTNGPLIQFEVDGELPGGEVHLPTHGGAVEISGRLSSIVPVDRMEVYFNGGIVQSIPLGKNGKEGVFRKRLPVTHSGWFTLRAIGAKSHHPMTIPMWSPRPARCMSTAAIGPSLPRRRRILHPLDWTTSRVSQSTSGWRTERERKHVLDQFDEARRIFEQRAGEASSDKEAQNEST